MSNISILIKNEIFQLTDNMKILFLPDYGKSADLSEKDPFLDTPLQYRLGTQV